MNKTLNIFKEVYYHPYNNSHPIEAFFRVTKWCLMKKILKRDYLANFWGYKINMWRDSAQSRFLAFFSLIDWQEFNFIKSYLHEGDHVFDVGANIGLYTLWMKKCTGPQGKVTAFEPDTKNHNRLVANIKLNKLSNVTIEKLALSNCKGIISFTAGQDVLNHVVFKTQNEQVKIEVEATTIDEYCAIKGIKQIALLKIDIEGAEYFAFQGADKMLEAGLIDVILFEMNYTMRRYKLQGSQVGDLLKKHGYDLYTYQVDTNELKLLEEEINIDKQMNYFAIRDVAKVRKNLQQSGRNMNLN
jgi:FkbM family methyltransferase